MLRLAGRSVLVVGGDSAAAQAAETLARCGGSVKLLSPELSARAKALVKAGTVQHQSREFAPRDIIGFFLAVAADEPVVNGLVLESAREAGVLCASLDNPADSDVELLPALALGPVLLGAQSLHAPLAGALLERATAALDEGSAEMAELMAKISATLLSTSDGAYQKRIMRALLESDVAELLRQGKKSAAEAKALRIVGQTTRTLKS
jgi:uroporphyrin-III C-methyltransferase/precorrin-2 dehydrogenase/sirohydrochlorin ferrochelatase